MNSLVRWMTAPDDTPRRAPSRGNAHNAVALRGNSRQLSRSADEGSQFDGVTYASKDDKRNVQFICHLPAGSQHAEQAQKIAGAIYTGRPSQANGKISSSGSGGRTNLLENSSRASLPAHQDREAVDRGLRHDDEDRRDIRVIVDDEEEEHDRSQLRDTDMRGQSSRKPSGFRHNSDTHTTYNMTDYGGRRKLFVSAPSNSREAEMHDQVATRAASVSMVGSVLALPPCSSSDRFAIVIKG